MRGLATRAVSGSEHTEMVTTRTLDSGSLFWFDLHTKLPCRQSCQSFISYNQKGAHLTYGWQKNVVILLTIAVGH